MHFAPIPALLRNNSYQSCLRRTLKSHPIRTRLAIRTTPRANMPAKDKYSDPKLRDEVKEEVQNSDKGGAPGQWSARKAQFMAAEYKKRGGGYNTDPKEKDESQKNLSKWTDEEWQTKEGSGSAKQKDGTQKRYLPKKAWEEMDEGEKKQTDEKKVKGSKQGKQFVGNTQKAKGARKSASKKTEAEESSAQEDQDDEDGDGDEEQANGEEARDEEGSEKEDEGQNAKSGQKRGRGKAQETSSKKQKADMSTKAKSGSKKTMGSKHDSTEAPAKQASASRLPKKGQTVTWKAMPGWVEGTVIEVVKSNKSVEGKSIKASKEDPRVVLRSHGPSKKVAVHKPEAIYFD